MLPESKERSAAAIICTRTAYNVNEVMFAILSTLIILKGFCDFLNGGESIIVYWRKIFNFC